MKHACIAAGIYLFTVPQDAHSLENSWRGKWKGPCKGQSDFGMEITIGNGEQDFDWILHYQGQSPRNYTMKSTAEKNVYILDENNGITITNFRFDNCLIDQFSVGGTKVDTRTCLLNADTLNFEVVSSKLAPFTKSGGGEVFTVRDYEIFDRYVCKLEKATS